MGENGDGAPYRSFAAFTRSIYRNMCSAPAGARTSLELRSDYGTAWIRHFFFEKNRPATSTYALYGVMGERMKF
jgi:Protein of unknown function (DUF962)